MYPDEQTLSAYLDDELTQSERTEVEAAISDDDGLRAQLNRLRAVRETLGQSLAEESKSFDWASEAHARVWNRLEVRTMTMEEPHGLSRTVRVPIAALVASAACFVALGAALLMTVIQNQQSPAPIDSIAAGRETPITINVDSQDTDKLLEWLSSNEMLGQVNVQLPSRPQFEIMGEPVLVPASEYRQKNQGGSRAP